MSADNNFILIRDWLEFALGLFSLLCSLMTLLIIYEMKIWNGNLLLITSLTLFQICYDINFMLGICPGFAACVIWHILDIFGGLAVAFTTNVISFTVFYVVHYVQSVNVIDNYIYFAIFMILIPGVFGIMVIFTLETANADDDKPFTECVYNSSELANVVANFYYWSRLASIGLNSVGFIYVWYRVRQLGFKVEENASQISASTSSDNPLSIFERKAIAVKALASRMIYYPVAQVITRAGSAWNEYNNYQYSNNASTIMSAICGSISGTVLFIVFLAMQPKAWEIFLCFLTCRRYHTDEDGQSNALNLSPQYTNSMGGTSNLDLTSMLKHIVYEFDDNLLEEMVNKPNAAIPQPSHIPGVKRNTGTMNPMRGSARMSNYEDDIMKDMS